MKYLKYLNYLLRHKWYVMTECSRMGLVWRGLMHDLSKFLPSEFIPYANYFYGDKATIYDGFYDPGNDLIFDVAWLKHIHRNPHHWQHYILKEDEGGVKILPMREPYLTEMICDWVGAGKAQGRFSPIDDKYLEVRNWWKINNHKMQFNINTRREIESRLELPE